VKSSSIVGILLIIFGAVALAYQGITYTTQKKVLDIGPIQATKEEHKTIPLPPIVGGIAMVGGIALLIAGSKNS
jgi:drug/metabolite transporter (DMT)-like permease